MSVNNGGNTPRFSQLVITFDHVLGNAAVTGKIPNKELGKALCIMGADEFERQIAEDRRRGKLGITPEETKSILDGMRRQQSEPS
jgi:hypothetical protein